MTVDADFIRNVATRVNELTGLETRVWPGDEIRIKAGDGKEVRASAAGFWQAHLFAREGGETLVPTMSQSIEMSEDSRDVDAVAQGITVAISSLLER